MRKVIIAGFLALISSLWAIAISVYVELNMADHWMNFHFLESAVQRGVIIPLALALLVLLVSVAYMLVVFCRKSKSK